jgi:hypothetical protein
MSRKKVKLLMEKEMVLSEEAERLLKNFNESEVVFLHRYLKREGEGRSLYRKVFAQKEFHEQ